MLDFVMSVIDCLAEINENNQMNTFNYLEINSQVTDNVTRELNRHHMIHFNEFSDRERQNLNAIIDWRMSTNTNLTARVQ